MSSVNAVGSLFIPTLDVALDSLGKEKSLGFSRQYLCSIKVTCFYFTYSAVKSLVSYCSQVVTGAWLLTKSDVVSMVVSKQQPRLLTRVGKFKVGKKSG